MDKFFAKFANATAQVTGRPVTFLACLGLVILWAVSGPIFKFSETWQLVINTGTTIITFLMVFLIQNTQNRDSEAVQAKLDELILTSTADNDFVGIEKLSEKELDAYHAQCKAAAERAHDRLEQVTALREKKNKAPAKKPAAKTSTAKAAPRKRASRT
ncbi:low affinity iron permease family protein [Caulobacter hibisci]|uniref:Low affinity iron permease family protein n=1 Tax=Caulobacter hibisci TaxID=2035993 RepID=A0ABS0SWI8_9CAUL|nr:low affinity iron permease family protein [Caulobacter hibisci]MBI1683995.1 low affinity iron permease family protein [Caulobacter hibisci]